MAVQERLEPKARPFSSSTDVSLLQVEEILGFVAHEIRSPLSVIHGAVMLATANKDLSQQDLQALREDATVATSRLTHLADTLLWLTRLEAGQPLESEPVSLVHLIPETVAAFEHLHKDVVIALDLSDALPLVAGEPSLIADVARNLVDNAVKYSPGCPDVEVAAELLQDEVLVSVRDHGIGVPAGELDAIFRGFHRCRNSGNIKGIGLGLRFCKLVVEAHRGRIWAELPEDGGLRVSFTLPVLTENLSL